VEKNLTRTQPPGHIAQEVLLFDWIGMHFSRKTGSGGSFDNFESKLDENDGFKVDSSSEFVIDSLLHSGKIGKIIVFWKQAIVG